MMHVIIVDEIDAAAAMTSRAPPGYRWACTSTTGLPPGKMRMTFLPESEFLKPGEVEPPSAPDEVDRSSHSYLLGVAEYNRDKFKSALEKIAAYEISDNLNYYNARRMIEIARAALREVEGRRDCCYRWHRGPAMGPDD